MSAKPTSSATWRKRVRASLSVAVRTSSSRTVRTHCIFSSIPIWSIAPSALCACTARRSSPRRSVCRKRQQAQGLLQALHQLQLGRGGELRSVPRLRYAGRRQMRGYHLRRGAYAVTAAHQPTVETRSVFSAGRGGRKKHPSKNSRRVLQRIAYRHPVFRGINVPIAPVRTSPWSTASCPRR